MSTTTASVRWRARCPTRSAAICATRPTRLLGLTFNSDADDMREAPSISLVAGLFDMGAEERAFDPVCMELAKNCLISPMCADGVDALVTHSNPAV
ncbi:UDP-glucose 6-dehydrogenase [Nitrobacteraceae bacterium AZCC 2146]